MDISSSRYLEIMILVPKTLPRHPVIFSDDEVSTWCQTQDARMHQTPPLNLPFFTSSKWSNYDFVPKTLNGTGVYLPICTVYLP